MNRQPRDHDAADRDAPPVPVGPGAGVHPLVRPVLRGHVVRRHLRSTADLPPRSRD